MSVKIIFEKAVKMMMKDTLFGECFEVQGDFVLFLLIRERQTYLTSGNKAGFIPGMQRSLRLEDQSL